MSVTPSMILTVQAGRNTNVMVASLPATSRRAKIVDLGSLLAGSGLHVSYAEIREPSHMRPTAPRVVSRTAAARARAIDAAPVLPCCDAVS